MSTLNLNSVLWHAQKRFAGDTRDMLQQWMEGKPFKEEHVARISSAIFITPPLRCLCLQSWKS